MYNQRDLVFLGHIGALALSALTHFSRQHRAQYEVPLRRPATLDPIAFAWARCNPGVKLPKALKGTPSALAMSLASVPQTPSGVGVRKAA